MTSVALVTVVHGEAFHGYARRMFASAERYFGAGSKQEFITLAGTKGWPWATLYRHHHVLDHFPDTDYVFLVDADMEFQGEVGNEILGEDLTAVLHPGYVNLDKMVMPFEDRHDSMAYVPPEHRKRYFAGGFIGGTAEAYKILAEMIRRGIDTDEKNDYVAKWHDESHLNRQLNAQFWPSTILSPSYCHPEDSSWYEAAIWTKPYERKLVALDKTKAERGAR